MIDNFSTWTDLEKVCSGVQWQWQGWLPKGLLTMLVGDQEQGKSALALRLAGCFILGWPWPDGTPFAGETGKVVWAECEAAQAMHLDRAKRWGIPREQIITPFTDPLQDFCLDSRAHRAALDKAIRLPDVRFLVVDSLGGSTGRDWRSSTMIEPVKSVATLLRGVNLPGLITHHLRKPTLLDGNTVTLDRISGNKSITQVARVVMAVDAPNLALPDNKRLSVTKTNLGRKPAPVGFSWQDDMLVFGNAPQVPQKETQRDRAKDILLALLRNGPMVADAIERELVTGAGISWRTVTRCKEDLRIVSIRKDGVWMWALPAVGA